MDDHIDIPYPISITHIPYRCPYRYLIDVRPPISVSHIDIPHRYWIISCHSGCALPWWRTGSAWRARTPTAAASQGLSLVHSSAQFVPVHVTGRRTPLSVSHKTCVRLSRSEECTLQFPGYLKWRSTRLKSEEFRVNRLSDLPYDGKTWRFDRLLLKNWRPPFEEPRKTPK